MENCPIIPTCPAFDPAPAVIIFDILPASLASRTAIAAIRLTIFMVYPPILQIQTKKPIKKVNPARTTSIKSLITGQHFLYRFLLCANKRIVTQTVLRIDADAQVAIFFQVSTVPGDNGCHFVLR
jgi:hypothetical protein